MRRNNFIFMWGRITQYTARRVKEDGVNLDVIDLRVETERHAVSGQHKVVVHGQQAKELLCFLKAEEPGLPDIAIQGWLCTLEDETVVVSDRFTVLTDHAARQRAMEAIRSQSSA
jgi:hypothetical protein